MRSWASAGLVDSLDVDPKPRSVREPIGPRDDPILVRPFDRCHVHPVVPDDGARLAITLQVDRPRQVQIVRPLGRQVPGRSQTCAVASEGGLGVSRCCDSGRGGRSQDRCSQHDLEDDLRGQLELAWLERLHRLSEPSVSETIDGLVMIHPVQEVEGLGADLDAG